MSWHKWIFEPRKLAWADKDPEAIVYDGFVCSHCGYWHRMHYPVPEATLKFLKVPDCEQHILKTVHDS